MPEVAETIAGIRAAIVAARSAGVARGIDSPRVALVPTMGALHEGHLALVERAGEIADIVVVSIFVNPTQFGPAEDLAKYPRNREADLALLASSAADLVFAPGVSEMYPNGTTSVTIVAGDVGSTFEGKTRPGHFDGVLTVVAKLLHICGPDVVLFGQKDAQQVFVVGRMIQDLDLPVSIDVVSTVREPDGLALSSRNRYLNGSDRRAALVLSALLAAASSAATHGVAASIESATRVARREPDVEIDYLAVVDPTTFAPVAANFHGKATMIVAANVGTTRLIDNVDLELR